MIVAELIKWNDEKISQEIRREWINDIVAAVVGQYLFCNNKDGFSIRGADFKHINVYEVKDEIHKPRTEETVQDKGVLPADEP